MPPLKLIWIWTDMWWCVCNRIWILWNSVFYLYCDYFGCDLDGLFCFRSDFIGYLEVSFVLLRA